MLPHEAFFVSRATNRWLSCVVYFDNLPHAEGWHLSTYVNIHIPAEIDPLDRYGTIEKPLNRALRLAGNLGKTIGGGSQMSFGPRGVRVEGCYLEVKIKNLIKALPVIREALVAAKVPAGTVVGHPESDTLLIHVRATGVEIIPPLEATFEPPPPRYPWAEGEVVGYRLTDNHWVLLQIAVHDAQGLMLRVLDWCGTKLPDTASILALVRRPVSKYKLAGRYLFPLARFQAFPPCARANRPRGLSLRRTIQTGLIAKLPRMTSNQGSWWTTANEFDLALRQIFELTPVDGATRLNHDLGLGPMHLHLAAWDALPFTTLRDAKRLFYAHAGRASRNKSPERGSIPSTENTKRFVKALKEEYREAPFWGWGSFRATEGFVIIPVIAARFEEVRFTAVRLGKAYGITVYDPQAHRLVRPPQQ